MFFGEVFDLRDGYAQILEQSIVQVIDKAMNSEGSLVFPGSLNHARPSNIKNLGLDIELH